MVFTIKYETAWGESLAVVLEGRKYPMAWQDGGIWTVSVPDCPAAALKDYTYVVLRDGLVWRTEWQHHHRSRIPAGRRCDDAWIDCPIAGCPFPRAHQADLFDRPGFRGAGTAVPVFSLRTADDFGMGDFRDLRPLVDWAVATGQCIIQLLPVNDTTRRGEWEDSYPYSPISSFALHPLYLRLQDLGIRPSAAFRAEQKELNALPEIDWPRVAKAKMAWIRKAYLARGARDLSSATCRKFATENAFWLDEYAAFCAHRDGLEPEYYVWMQYHLDKQLSEEVRYARAHGVYFKGDLPIGVSADSAEAHFHPELFNLDCSAGAPPDYFSADGQNWGFPTYNWEAMEADGYAWWKSRLRVMSRYFDAFRIDHIIGWFRIWEIPVSCRSGLQGHFNPALPYSAEELDGLGFGRFIRCHLIAENLGICSSAAPDKPATTAGLFLEDPHRAGWYHPFIGARETEAYRSLPEDLRRRFDELYVDFFYHRHDAFWQRNAEKKLPELLGATGMLACGEDLGMVPDCLPGVMEHEKILSLKMRGYDGPTHTLSVCATSSHDTATLRMSCPEDPSPETVRGMLAEVLAYPSMLAIFPIQDWLALSGELRNPDRNERINEPADPHHHWRWRLHLDLSVLSYPSATAAFNSNLRELLAESGRLYTKE
ncbi:MAG: 4-alpha-glucanotransferase [Bacteroidales bacterium]|nr:4-alpha-glucanotransferase [Bacteroidales bacterium]